MSFIGILQHYPNGKRKRRSFLRIEFLNKRKCFFDLFIRNKLSQYSGKDLKRRYDIALELPSIFKKIKPSVMQGHFVFETKNAKVIVKEIINRNQSELHLLSLYPK